MSCNEYKTETVEKHGLEFKAIWEIDEDPDTSFLGEFGSEKPDGHYVDRNTGILYSGECVKETRTFDVAPEGYEGNDEFSVFVLLDNDNKNVEIITSGDNTEWLETAEDRQNIYSVVVRNGKASVICDVKEVLATGLWAESRYNSDRESNFFGGTQHLPYKASDWAHVETHDALDAEEEARIKKLGIEINRGDRCPDEVRCILHACEDHQRMEHYCNDDWTSLNLHVTLDMDGEEFESRYCGGYESDMSDADKQSGIDEHITEIMHNLPKEIAKRVESLAKIVERINAIGK